MGRLSNLKPAIGTLGSRLRVADDQGHSRTLEPWRAWYSLARWKRLRLQIFERDGFTCQDAECGRLEGDTSRLVCDHVEPHRGDPRLFWSEGNLQTLCKPCHDGRKQAAERASRLGGGG